MVAPTREIAIQIRDVIRNVGKYLKGFQCEAIIGGLDTQNDAKKMRHCQVIVGTPGTLDISFACGTLSLNVFRASNGIDTQKLDEDAKYTALGIG